MDLAETAGGDEEGGSEGGEGEGRERDGRGKALKRRKGRGRGCRRARRGTNRKEGKALTTIRWGRFGRRNLQQLGSRQPQQRRVTPQMLFNFLFQLRCPTCCVAPLKFQLVLIHQIVRAHKGRLVLSVSVADGVCRCMLLSLIISCRLPVSCLIARIWIFGMHVVPCRRCCDCFTRNGLFAIYVVA